MRLLEGTKQTQCRLFFSVVVGEASTEIISKPASITNRKRERKLFGNSVWGFFASAVSIVDFSSPVNKFCVRKENCLLSGSSHGSEIAVFGDIANLGE